MVGKTREGKFPQYLLIHRGAAAEHDGRGHVFAQARMRDGEGQSLGHRRMLPQGIVDFAWRDLLTAAVDHLFDAPGEVEIPVLVDVALLAGPEPAVLESGCIGGAVVTV